MPNIYQVQKKFTGRLGNKPCLIWLLKIPPNLTYVTIVLCNLLLITALVFDRPPFSDVSVSRCSVAMHMRCGGIAANLLENLTVSVKRGTRCAIDKVGGRRQKPSG